MTLAGLCSTLSLVPESLHVATLFFCPLMHTKNPAPGWMKCLNVHLTRMKRESIARLQTMPSPVRDWAFETERGDVVKTYATDSFTGQWSCFGYGIMANLKDTWEKKSVCPAQTPASLVFG